MGLTDAACNIANHLPHGVLHKKAGHGSQEKRLYPDHRNSSTGNDGKTLICWSTGARGSQRRFGHRVGSPGDDERGLNGKSRSWLPLQ